MPRGRSGRSFCVGAECDGSQLKWRQRLDQTYDFLMQIREARTTDEICSATLGHLRHLGATGLLAGVIPPPGAMSREQFSHVLLDAWPTEWARRYFSRGYLYRDPAIELIRCTSEPFMWSEIGERCELSSSARRVMEEATEFRLNDGLTFGFRSLERSPIGFSIAGEKLELDPVERRAAELVAAYAVVRAMEIRKSLTTRPAVPLSPRQLDVLRWASEGLKAVEIADRLSISVHTADMHLRAIREKLGVGSTVHAVAEAFRHGILS